MKDAEPFDTARLIGSVVQGVAVGLLLFAALLRLVETSSVGQVFRYQGF
jgi:hypothetical protein